MGKKLVVSLLVLLFRFDFAIQAQNTCAASKQAQSSMYYSAENLRSDTFDVLKYTISLDIGTTSSPQIKGNTQIRFAPKLNNRLFIRFDLLKLIVDSVKENNSLLTYSYNDTILKINFVSPKNTTDTSVVTVFYRGNPQIDATGWGGFYFNNTQSAQYAYNLGVGFGAKPHNYGRVWFPCFDNFVEKSKYEFFITTDIARRSFCNGQLMAEQLNGGLRTRHWVLNEEIPTYLAQVNAAQYEQVNWNMNALNGNLPIQLVAYASDTTSLKNGFVNLKSCISGFENYFGPYRWNKVGYSVVPFNSGAMEHATNITYPRNSIGNLAFESLMAHELSHHWWGNLVTCETAEDMWINEGMASYCADLFYEWRYGEANARDRIMDNHESILHNLFKSEGWRSVSGVPHDLTYGSHVYEKGEDIAHSLRGYMGDTAFFNGCKFVMQQRAYKNLNTNEFRDLLQTNSGINLTSFFSNWVLSPGWAHFSVDSVKYVGPVSNGTTQAIVYIKQKSYGPAPVYSDVPLRLTFYAPDWSYQEKRVMMSGSNQSFTLSVPANSNYLALNMKANILDATSHEYKIIKNTGNFSFNHGKLPVQVSSAGQDSSLLRIVHHYVRPDDFKTSIGARISNQHYWSVEGIWSAGFKASAQFNYNGFKTIGGEYSFLDTNVVIINADSLALFYRKNAGDDWVREVNVQKTTLSQKSGYFTVDSLKQGEYTFASLSDPLLSLGESKLVKQSLIVFPNPARHTVKINIENPMSQVYTIKVISVEGKTVFKDALNGVKKELDVSNFAKGTYTIAVYETNGQEIGVQKLIID